MTISCHHHETTYLSSVVSPVRASSGFLKTLPLQFSPFPLQMLMPAPSPIRIFPLFFWGLQQIIWLGIYLRDPALVRV